MSHNLIVQYLQLIAIGGLFIANLFLSSVIRSRSEQELVRLNKLLENEFEIFKREIPERYSIYEKLHEELFEYKKQGLSWSLDAAFDFDNMLIRFLKNVYLDSDVRGELDEIRMSFDPEDTSNTVQYEAVNRSIETVLLLLQSKIRGD